MNPFKAHIDSIGQNITIDDADRQIYTKDFDIIRDYILKIMRLEDHVFKILCKGPSLFGSYSNNVRINLPKEFDVHIKLSPPFAKEIVVEVDHDRPGFVKLNFKYVLEMLEDIPNSSDVYDQLYNMTDRNYYLVRGKVQRWLKEIIVDGLHRYGYKVRGSRNDLYTIQYSKRGLAHTIFASCPVGWQDEKREISIDLVPAFMFGKEDWMTLPQEHIFQYKCKRWYAVPKPIGGPKSSRRIAFMICNPNTEHDLLLNKYNLKVVFRLLKSLRKKYELNRIKSYFITTVFLWEIKAQRRSFWKNSIDYLFIHMLGKLTDYFLDRSLPFFWNSELDLLDILSDDEITSYGDSLVFAYNLLITYTHQPLIKFDTVACHFDC